MAAQPSIAVPTTWAPNQQRDLFLSFAIAISALVIAGLLRGETGLKMLPVALGWPHIILGFVFYCGKIIRGERLFRSLFILLSLLTAAIWWTHYQIDITRLIYLFFFYHAFTDEIFLPSLGGLGTTKTRLRLALAAVAVALLLLVPHPRDLLINLRQTQITSAQIRQTGPTLVSFDPVPHSKGRQFYFYLVAPHTSGVEDLTTQAALTDAYANGRVLVNDEYWAKASDLLFRPHYAAASLRSDLQDGSSTVPVLLTGGHRVGQTFTAEEDNLAGIWLPIQSRNESTVVGLTFVLQSQPSLSGRFGISSLRLLVVLFLLAFALWAFGTTWLKGREPWAGLMVFATLLAGLQAFLNDSIRLRDIDTHLFQLVVVFRYLLWYSFSFHKLKMRQSGPPQFLLKGRYDRFLSWVGQPLQFSISVLLLNVVSFMGVLWYSSLGGPAILRFAFDYKYFLYALVFHVTFSLKPTSLRLGRGQGRLLGRKEATLSLPPS